MIAFGMTVPETTSAEGLERYVGGKCLFESRGEAWRDIKAWIVALPPIVDTLHLPSVSEPFLAWTFSGEVDFQEREYKRPWILNRIRKGSFFFTSGGAPYETRWKAVTSEPFEAMLVFVELPLLQRALEEVFGADAAHTQLRDVSAFHRWVAEPLFPRVLPWAELLNAFGVICQILCASRCGPRLRNGVPSQSGECKIGQRLESKCSEGTLTSSVLLTGKSDLPEGQELR